MYPSTGPHSSKETKLQPLLRAFHWSPPKHRLSKRKPTPRLWQDIRRSLGVSQSTDIYHNTTPVFVVLWRTQNRQKKGSRQGMKEGRKQGRQEERDMPHLGKPCHRRSSPWCARPSCPISPRGVEPAPGRKGRPPSHAGCGRGTNGQPTQNKQEHVDKFVVSWT